MSAEIKSYSELPAENIGQKTNRFSTEQNDVSYTPFNEDDDYEGDDDNVYPGALVGNSDSVKPGSPTPSVSSAVNDSNDNENIDYKSIIADAVKSDDENKDIVSKISANYEAMTLKELQTLAKTRGISGAGSMKKGAIIEALKTSDRSSGPVQPGLIGTASSSFLETSAPFLSAADSE
jgi:hypothetical protein